MTEKTLDVSHKPVTARHTPPVAPAKNDYRITFLLFFFCSGACGLIYEVVWTKFLGLVMSNTVYSIATVLTAFMGGLALGSWIAGRLVDRRRDPLLIYGILEFLIGAYCLLLPTLIDMTYPIYSSFYRDPAVSFYQISLVRFAICGTLLLIPTTLMGATLPVLSKYFVVSQDRVGGAIAMLYSANTFGAVTGAFLTGFILLPTQGIGRTTLLAALINMTIGIGATLLHFEERKRLRAEQLTPNIAPTVTLSTSPKIAEAAPVHRGMLFLALSTFLISGFCAMVYQLVWSRVGAMIYGSSTYSFSMVVTAFILGLALGSSILGSLSDRIKNPMLALGIVQALIGVLCLIIAYILGRLPLYLITTIFRDTNSYVGGGYYLLLMWEFLILFAIVLIPTMLMGATFPLVAKLCSGSLNSIGKSIGTAYAWNTVGAILGSFTGGFILMPTFGLEVTILIAVVINIVSGIVLMIASDRARHFNYSLVGILLGLVCFNFCLHTPRWDGSIMSAGVYYYGTGYYEYARDNSIDLEQSIKDQTNCVYYKEGLTCTVAVYQTGDNMYYRTNGKVEASTTGDMPTQTLVAQIPLFLHRNPESALLIGLGGGMTLGSIRQHDSLKKIDCVEISQEVIEGAGYFYNYNHQTKFDNAFAERPKLVEDPRVELIVGDGRNHVSLTDRTYDVIISEPSNPWIAGLSSLFSKEFYSGVKTRLNDKGIFCQWIHTYSMVADDFRVAVKTFHESFPYSQMWQPGGGSDYFMIGSLSPITFDFSNIKDRLDNNAKLSREIDSVLENKYEDPMDRMYNLIGCFLTDREGMKNMFYQSDTLNTDNNCYLEYHAPRNLYVTGEKGDELDRLIEKNLAPLAPYVFNVSANPEVEHSVLMNIRAKTLEKTLGRLRGKLDYWSDEFDPNKPLQVEEE